MAASALVLGVVLLALGVQGGRGGLWFGRWLAPITGAATSLQAFGRIGVLARENEELRLRVASLQAEKAALQAAAEENRRLTALLELKQSRFTQGLPARVAARDPSGWFNEVGLDLGHQDGVRPEMVAVSPEGLVGCVSQLTRGGCRVRLLVAAGSAVPVMLARSGAVGILYGDGGYTCQLKFVSHDVEVKAGEDVLTSGLGEIYPGGLLVGHVIRNYGRTEALFQSLEVQPAVDIGRLREVLLVQRRP